MLARLVDFPPCWAAVVAHLDVFALLALSASCRAGHALAHLGLLPLRVMMPGSYQLIDERRLKVLATNSSALAFAQAWHATVPLEIRLGPSAEELAEWVSALLAVDARPSTHHLWVVDARQLARLPAGQHPPGVVHLMLPATSTDAQLATALSLKSVPNIVGLLARCCLSISQPAPLAHLHSVDLSFCPSIDDVRCLANVHTLDLASTHVRDVSALGNVYSLNLTGCKGVRDVSALGRVARLYLRHCSNIVRGFDNLGHGNHLLDLSYTDISAVAHLGRVHALDLAHCRHVREVANLHSCYFLELAGSRGLTSLAPLTGVRHVRVTALAALRDCRGLSAAHTVELISCINMSDLSQLSRVVVVCLTDLPQLRSVDLLEHVQELTVLHCESLRQIAGLPRCRRLTLGNLPRLASIAGLTSSPKLAVEDCPALTLATVAAAVPGGPARIAHHECAVANDNLRDEFFD